MTFDPIKDPDAVLDYQWDWTSWLGEGETITDIEWLVPDGITQQTTSATDSTATIWLAEGSLGHQYDITCRITTNQDRTDDRTQTIRIQNR